MDGSNKMKPKFWINPNTRINFPFFSIEWHKFSQSELLPYCKLGVDKETYCKNNNCVHVVQSENGNTLHILYSDNTKFENILLQKWLRMSIKDAVIYRAEQVLPKRLHELELRHQLYAKSVRVEPLRKGVLGQCSHDNHIWLSPIIVIFPKELMDNTILHEMAHLKFHHHRKSFWQFLSSLLGTDAKEQHNIQNLALNKYWELYVFLMK